jgi:AraC-like DNA-binding protein
MTLHIKYMVSLCCIKMVKTELDNLDIEHGIVELGEVAMKKALPEEERSDLKKVLHKIGFHLIDDPKAILIEKIKNAIIDMVHYSDEMPKINYSTYLSKKLDYDYSYLSATFSDIKGETIENYIIKHKIERVKELLLYNELTLTQISYQLDYSSVAHLSNQFKKITGLTPTYFKQMKKKKRTPIEEL